MKTATQKLLEKPINEWPRLIEAMENQDGNRQEIEQQLSALIQRATLLHGYLGHRYNSGCGKQSHVDSAKYANKALVKVRKALGYSYPKMLGMKIQ